MIRINEFMRSYDQSKMSKEDYWNVRQQYENLSNKEKRSFDRKFVKMKERFGFEEWWEYIGGRIKEGNQQHIRDLNRPFLTNPKIEKLKEEVNSQKFKDYHRIK